MISGLLQSTDGQALKVFRRGTHRVVRPEETISAVLRFAPVMGITRVANVTGLDRVGIPVVMVCRPNSRSLAVSQGKGLDLASAKASGLMEATEQYHAERIHLPLKLASYEELRYTHSVVDVTTLPQSIGSLFHPDRQLLWIEGYELLQDETVWVPYEMVHTDYTLPFPTGSGCFIASSSGLASGNHVLEAMSHAICEVVERDSTTLWNWLDQEMQHSTRLDLATVDDPDCRQILEKYEEADVAVAVWDATTDVGIPAFTCTIVDRVENPLRVLYAAGGSGCHPARHIALSRALTEAAQSRLTFIAGSRDDGFRRRFEHNRSPDLLRIYRSQMEIKGPMRDFHDIPSGGAETLDADVAWELDCLRSAGIRQVVVVDLTKPEFRLPVVRVVIPGLEGTDHSPAYAPGARARAIIKTRT